MKELLQLLLIKLDLGSLVKHVGCDNFVLDAASDTRSSLYHEVYLSFSIIIPTLFSYK